MRNQNKKTNKKINSNNIPNECYLVFIKKSINIREYSNEFIITTLAIYFCYGLYEEIFFLVNFLLKKNKINDPILKDRLNKILTALD